MSDEVKGKRPRQVAPPMVLQPLVQFNKDASKDLSNQLLTAPSVDLSRNIDESNETSQVAISVTSGQRLIPMNMIVISPYQNRIFTKDSDEFIADLAANIYKEELNNPILVREIAGGEFELLAGENRYRAYKINGMSEIPACVKIMDDIAAAKTTILDNVFHSPVSPFELYLGYKTLLSVGAYQHMTQLGKEVGISSTEMSRLFSFGKFPDEITKLLKEHPNAMGSNTASDLIKYVDSHPGLLLEAVKKIIDGMNQKRAVGWIKSKIDPKVNLTPRIITNGDGKTKFTIKRKPNGIEIIGDTEHATEDVVDLIYDLLEKEAKNNREE